MFRGQTFLEITFKQMPRLTQFEYLSKGYKEKLSIFEILILIHTTDLGIPKMSHNFLIFSVKIPCRRP